MWGQDIADQKEANRDSELLPDYFVMILLILKQLKQWFLIVRLL
jgi:hypothetical protein